MQILLDKRNVIKYKFEDDVEVKLLNHRIVTPSMVISDLNAFNTKLVTTSIDIPDGDWVYDEKTDSISENPYPLIDGKESKIASIGITDYIHLFYPQWKQMSDASDKENGDSYIVMLGGDSTAVRKKIAEIVTSGAAFTDGLEDLLATFPTPVDATHWEYWLEQLLKIGYRQFFVFNVKQEYKVTVEAINKATTVEELNTINTTFKTVYPL